MTSLSKFVLLSNKFTVPDIGIKNEDSVLEKASISSSRQDDSALLAITATLPFEEAKPLPGRKKTCLSARSETLKVGKGQTLPWTVDKAELLAAVERGAAV